MKDPRMIDALSHLSMTDTQKRAVFDRILAAADAAPQSEPFPTRTAMQPRRKAARARTAWKPALTAAAFLLALGITLSIPEVSNALRDFFHNSFRIEQYMAAAEDEREVVAEYEAAIQTPDPYMQVCRVELLSETDQLDEVNGYRAEQGFSAYDPAPYAWVKDLRCEVTEVFYDGKNLYANMTLNASPLKFFRNDTPFPTEDMENYDIMGDRFGSVFQTTAGTVAAEYGACWLNQERYWKEGEGVQDNEALRAATHTDLEASWEFERMPALPDGPVTVTLPIWVMDAAIDDFAAVGRIARITVTFTFDATDGNASLTERGKGKVTLSGTVPATFVYDENPADSVFDTVYELRNTDLSGIVLSAAVTQRDTGLWIGLDFAKSANWAYDDDQFRQLCFNLICDIYLDGVLVRERAHIGGMGFSDNHGIELMLTKSEVGEAREIRLVPYMEYVSSYQPPEEWGPRQEAFHKAHPDLNDLPSDEIERLLRELSDAQRAAATPLQADKPLRMPSDSNIWLEEIKLEDCDLVIPLA